MGRRKLRQWLVGAATITLLTTACSGGSSEEGDSSPGEGDATTSTGEASGGSFSAQSGEPSFLAPTSQCYESECSSVINTVYSGLLTVDPETSEQVLTGAESIESDDSKVWTIKLKEGWTFHNGEPADAAAYLRAWNYSAYGPNATQTGFFFSPVEGYDDLQGEKPKAKEMSGLKMVDDTTIEVTLSKPFSQWPLVMSYTPAFAPIAQECLDDLKACNDAPIGNGPYQIDGEWEHNSRITVTKFPDFKGEDAGQADEIVFQIYGDQATAFRDWQAGNLDITSPDPSQVAQAGAIAGDRVVQVDSGTFAYLGFPFYEEAYQDLKVRQALSLAIDREAIIDKVYSGLFTPAQDVIAPFVPGSRDDACEYCVYDPERAKQLLDEAGGIPGDTVTIWFNNDGGHEQFIQAVANGWRNDLGLDFELESQPFTPYLESLGAGKANGPYRLGWAPDYPSPENYLDPIYGEGSSNYGQWSGPAHEEFLKLVEEGDASIEEGIASYQQAADVVLRELPVIPLWFGQTYIVYSQNVDNVTYDPLRNIVLTEVTVN
jgi:ABC-type transport system substrate-binding protein